jgi:hypothetical protein
MAVFQGLGPYCWVHPAHRRGPVRIDDALLDVQENSEVLNKHPLITLKIFIEVSPRCNKKLLKHTSPTELLITGKYILNTAVH